MKSTITPGVDLNEIPTILLFKIFEYVEIALEQRLINKKFNDFILKNIKTLHFQDEVNDKSFNKLSKYAINVSGRLKNVRNI